MATRNISLTPQQDAFIEQVVESGEYQNASEAMRDALRALQQRRQEDAAKLKALRAMIAEGRADIERGAFTDVDPTEFRSFLAGLGRPPAKKANRRRKR
jgi:antitoxin ParD1/3/4